MNKERKMKSKIKTKKEPRWRKKERKRERKPERKRDSKQQRKRETKEVRKKGHVSLSLGANSIMDAVFESSFEEVFESLNKAKLDKGFPPLQEIEQSVFLLAKCIKSKATHTLPEEHTSWAQDISTAVYGNLD